MQTLDDETLGQAQTYELYKNFINGRISVEDDESSKCSSTGVTDTNVAKVCQKINEDREKNHNIYDPLGLSCVTCQQILLEELGMNCISAKWVPYLLMTKRTQSSCVLCRELKEHC